MLNIIYEISILFFIILSAFFSGTETAILSASSIKLKSISEKGNRRAKRSLAILENIEDALGMTLVGNNIANIAATAFITFVVTKAFLFKETELIIITVIQAIIFLILCEIIPKITARSKAESFIMLFSLPISLLIIILKPAVWMSLLLSKFFKALFNLETSNFSNIESRDEIGSLFKLGEKEGIIKNDHHTYVTEILSFREITAEEIMTPSIDIISIERKQSIKQLVLSIEKTRFSRIPVYEERVDNIIGYVYFRDLLRNPDVKKIDDILKKPYFIPSTKKVSELLPEMQENKISLVFVVNEFGGVEGLITKEDIAEEIVGEIQTRDHPDEELIKKIDENSYILSGSLDIEYFQRLSNLEIEKKGFETVAGFVTYLMGKIPRQGEKVEYRGYRFIIYDSTERSVEKILYEKS